MGKLTGVMFDSATKRGRFANLFEVQDGPNYEASTFRYSIDLTKLPYAKYFDDKRHFFYLEAEEGMKVMKNLQGGLVRKLHQLYKL